MVVVALRNSPEHLYATFGAWKLGASVLPLRWDLPVWERERLLTIADPTVVIADWEEPAPGTVTRGDLVGMRTLSSAPPEPDRVPDNIRLIATSGATGTPKIVVAPSPGLYTIGEYMPVMGDTSGLPYLTTSALYHVNGFAYAYNPLLQDSWIVLMERFDAARAVDLIERYRVAYTVMVPTMLQRIARLDGVRDRDFSSIERLVYGGASVPEWVVRKWLELVPPERFVLSYGGSEGWGVVTTTGDQWLKHPGTCGRPLNSELKIVDEHGNEVGPGEIGEIYMRTDAYGPRFRYIGVPNPEPDPGGWGSFGDLGYVDEDGFLYIADRRRDMIVSGGANVFPAEVEAALSEHPDVLDAVVIGLPDPEWGHRVHAVVQPSDPVHPPTADELHVHCRARLAPYKTPKSFEIVERVPRSAAGKVSRSALVDERAAT
jgi:bile acid-coenzyme A ligase